MPFARSLTYVVLAADDLVLRDAVVHAAAVHDGAVSEPRDSSETELKVKFKKWGGKQKQETVHKPNSRQRVFAPLIVSDNWEVVSYRAF